MNISKELLEKAKTANSAEELLDLAKAASVELTTEEAVQAFAKLNKNGELSDEALAAAIGGATMPDLSVNNLQGRTVDKIRCPLCKGVADYSASMFTVYYFTCRNCKQKLTTVFLRTGEIFTTPGSYTVGVVE